MAKKTKVVDFPVRRDASGRKVGVDFWLQRLFEEMANQFDGRVSLLQEFHCKLLLEIVPGGGGPSVRASIKAYPNESGIPLVTVDNGSGPVVVQDVPSAVLAVITR